MSPTDFKAVFKELLDIEQNLILLRREEKLRNSLKILGVGFLFYKNVQSEIEKNLSRKKILLEDFDGVFLAYINSLRNDIQNIRTSNSYLGNESLWIDRIDVSKREIAYLRSISVLDKSRVDGLLTELDGFHYFVKNYNFELEKSKLRQQLLLLKSEVLQSEKELNSLYYGQSYFSKRDLNEWKYVWSDLVRKIDEIRAKADFDVDFHESIERIANAYREGETWLESRNSYFKETEILQYKDYFDSVEKLPLTKEQREAIVTDEVNNLVVAGAGTGKTSVIVGKAGYLIEKGLAKPEEILLLSFNKHVYKELEKRIESRLKRNLQVYTYHRFGLKVIKEATSANPSVSELAEDKAKFYKKILEFIKNRMKDPAFSQMATEYFLYYFTPCRSIPDFKSFREYVEYVRNIELRSLKGNKVKSFEECSIANFLYINGIEYQYERPYEIAGFYTNNRRYKPDFYLPKYQIYIEHFGINREGKTAPYVSQNEYSQEMRWKCDIHNRYGTKLIQTFSYEHTEGILLTNLEKKLHEKGVVFNPMAKEQILSNLEELGAINQLSRLIANFLNLLKSSGKGLNEIDEEISRNDVRARIFIKIFSAIYDDYASYLKETGEIDFNDMLNEAVRLVLSRAYLSHFKYILVDEFQDISYSRYLFLKTLLDQNKSRLFAVGDDWQSIYRFTGSDISIMVDFEKNFGFSETCLLQQSFRLNDKLCRFSTGFILRNPLQIKKNIRSTTLKSGPSVSLIRGETGTKVKEILDEISRKSEQQSVLIIGRYRRLEREHLNLFLKTPYLDVEYTTAHKSKGREADYVIIIGLKGGRMGFPCQIVDDPILEMVLAKSDHFPNAEERRLFYVALTRAKKHVYLIDDPNFVSSSFVSEILNGGYEINSTGQPLKTELCPKCETGEIVAKNGKYGRFFQCNNYPYCDYTPVECPKCRNGFLQRGEMISRCSNDSCSFSTNT